MCECHGSFEQYKDQEMKIKCSICKAKSKASANYKGRFLCPECTYEYRCVFEGWKSNKSKKKGIKAENDELKSGNWSMRTGYQCLQPWIISDDILLSSEPTTPIKGFWQICKKGEDDNTTL